VLIAACGGFAAICGSSVATAASLMLAPSRVCCRRLTSAALSWTYWMS
jgi:hypothetical protein